MAARDDAIDALFAEAFALLDAVDAPSAPSLTPPPRAVGQRRKKQGQGSAARRKRWLDALRGEHAQLCVRLTRLRDRTAYSAARERALDERAKRRHAERECARLREALYEHTMFVHGLRGLVSGDAPSSLRLNLYHQLHNFTRLPCDASVRQLEYAALRQERRFAFARALLERETAALPLAGAKSHVDFAHASDEPSAITTRRVYVLETGDVDAVRRAACTAVHDIVARCRRYKWVGVAGASVDTEALEASGAQYTVTSIHRTNGIDADVFPFEARSLTMHKTTPDSALVVWDFVDDDELHPPGGTHDVFRQSIGACLIRPEVCPDGATRTVYREVSTRRYECRGPAPPPVAIVRYVASKRSDIDDYEQIYHDLMLALVAREEAAIHVPSLVQCNV